MKTIGRTIATIGLCGVWFSFSGMDAAPILAFLYVVPFMVAVGCIWEDGK